MENLISSSSQDRAEVLPARRTLVTRSFSRDALHVFVLLSFAFSEPQLERLQNQTPFVSRMDFESLAIYLVTLCLLIPGLVVAGEWLLGRWDRRFREIAHAVVLFVGFTLLLLPIWKATPSAWARWQVPLSLLTAALFDWAYFRLAGWRTILTVASPVIVVSPLLFTITVYGERSQIRSQRGVADVEARNPVPVVVVAFDEFNGTSLMDADREIDAARYPNFAALAQESTWFRNASGVHVNTVCALPAILSGNYPKSETGPELREYPRNLFTILSATGKYEMVAFEPFTRLGPSEEFTARSSITRQTTSLFKMMSVIYLYQILPDSFRSQLPDLKRAWFGWPEPGLLDTSARTGVVRHPWDTERDLQFEHFLECISPSLWPRLYFTHITLPHYPWCYTPTGKKYRMVEGAKLPESTVTDASSQRELWGSDELLTTHGYQRYLLQVGYVDHLLGKLVDRLKSANLYDECLLILVADHGVSFRANQSRRVPKESNLADIMSVPLLVKLPHQREGGISDRNVATIDVLPTITDVLGLQLPFPMDGTSLAGKSTEERGEKRFQGEGETFTIDAEFASKYDTLQDRLARFGAGRDPDRFYRVGPHSELVGRELSELVVSGRSAVPVEVDSPHSFEMQQSDVDVPCCVLGRVLLESSDARLPVELAIAVNGKIRAVTRTYGVSGLRQTWSAMLPESAFREGQNNVRIFRVSSGENQLTLEDCTPSSLAADGNP